MASPTSGQRLGELPDEIILRILSFLEPHDLPSLQSSCRKLRKVSLDNNLWRSRTFDESPFLEALERRRVAAHEVDDDILDHPLLHTAGSAAHADHDASSDATTHHPLHESAEAYEAQRNKDIANWDPAFPGEPVFWYSEYVQRYAPTVTNWFQQPLVQDGNVDDPLEVRGVALYEPPSQPGNMFAVSPLDDGSICLWDVKGRQGGRKGATVARSEPEMLYIDGLGAPSRDRRMDSSVIECISVDSQRGIAFVAVQGHLLEVDLETLQVVSDQSFEWSIKALSSASPTTPLTVGTSLGIHLYDHRSRLRPTQNGAGHIFDPDPLPQYAPLPQPNPLSVLHLPEPGNPNSVTHDIYVAGRFRSILHYDRRKFGGVSSTVSTIHSGASLSALACLPFPFSPLDSEVRRRSELSVDQVRESKAKAGRTLMACGEYNSKGSLELYSLPATDHSNAHHGRQYNSNLKNRQNAAQSKILSITNHGTRIVFSDGSGYIKWFERDGFTEVRRHRIGHSQRERVNRPSIFSGMPGIDDLARKILSTETADGDDRMNDDEVLFWTGDKLGLVSFSSKPGFQAEDFEGQQVQQSEEDEKKEREEQEYSERMRLALERQAEDVRIVRNLGLGV